VLGRLARRADHLFVALVADQHDVVVVGGEAARLDVHLGDQRAGRVDRPQAARGRLVVDGRGDAVRGQHDGRALGDLLGLLDEDRAERLEPLDHVDVVHDLLAHVDRRAVDLQRLLDGLHGPVDACAVAAGLASRTRRDGVGMTPVYGRPPRLPPGAAG
jgi:hypothetical protein